VAHGFMTTLSGSQIKPPALPEVADFVQRIAAHVVSKPPPDKKIKEKNCFY